MNKTKKRKYNEISMDVLKALNATVEEAHLKVQIPSFLPCEICKNPIFHYQTLKNCIVCSHECFTVWKLSQKNAYLHEYDPVFDPDFENKPLSIYKSFEGALKRANSDENLDSMDTT